MTAPAKPPAAQTWAYLAPNPKSAYKQLFIKGTRIRAEVLYGMTVDGSEPMTPEEVAVEMEVPLEVVREAIAYCESNPEVIAQDHAAEETLMQASSMRDPDYRGKPRLLSPQEMARLRGL